MIRKTSFAILFALTISAFGSAEDACLYSLDLASPYSGVTARFELWGEAGSAVQSYVNALFYAGDRELPDVVRVMSARPVTIRWSLSPETGGESLKDVYARLGGGAGSFSGDGAARASLSLTFGSFRESFSASSSEQSGSIAWNEGSIGVFRGEVRFSFSVADMLSFDAVNGRVLDSGFGHPLASKTIRFEWVRGVSPDLSVSDPVLRDGRLVSSVSLPSGAAGVSSCIRSVNLWSDGAFLSPDACSLSLTTNGNGQLTGECSWRYEPGKQYQLQVVDLYGNSQSVWYPRRDEQQREGM